MIRLTLEFDDSDGDRTTCSVERPSMKFSEEGIGYLAGCLMEMCRSNLVPEPDWPEQTLKQFLYAFNDAHHEMKKTCDCVRAQLKNN